eukprot:gene8728-6134_t
MYSKMVSDIRCDLNREMRLATHVSLYFQIRLVYIYISSQEMVRIQFIDSARKITTNVKGKERLFFPSSIFGFFGFYSTCESTDVSCMMLMDSALASLKTVVWPLLHNDCMMKRFGKGGSGQWAAIVNYYFLVSSIELITTYFKDTQWHSPPAPRLESYQRIKQKKTERMIITIKKLAAMNILITLGSLSLAFF